ncbi:MAG: hypothetical protein ABDH31_00680 [Chlorobiota bacterium]
MAWRWAVKLISLGCAVWTGGCVSPVELPTEREVLPPKVPLVLEESSIRCEVQYRSDTFTWTSYAVNLEEASIDTSRGSESLYLAALLWSVGLPVDIPAGMDSVEFRISGLRSGLLADDLSSIQSLRLTSWERKRRAVVRRVLSWRQGRPVPKHLRLRYQLIRALGPSPRWILTLSFLVTPSHPEGPKDDAPILRLHVMLSLKPR